MCEVQGDPRIESRSRGALHFDLFHTWFLGFRFLVEDADLLFPLIDPRRDHSCSFEDQEATAEDAQVLLEALDARKDLVGPILLRILQDRVEGPGEWAKVFKQFQIHLETGLI